MAELSESRYRNHLRGLIDRGVYDPDELFRGLIELYFRHDRPDDWIWDAQDDMENIFDAMGDVLAENFRGQPPGTSKETDDAKRFRKVRNWVESVEYRINPQTKKLQLAKATKRTNASKKFDGRMDAVMHFVAGGAIAANIGETLSDIISWGVEVTDEVKSWFKGGVGYDSVDLQWGRRGSELQNAFDVSDANARKLAKKFADKRFLMSRWRDWYNKSDSVLY